MSKEIAKKKNEVATPHKNPFEVDQDSILIGKILLGQKTSPAIDEGKAQIGDIFIKEPFRNLAKLGGKVKITPVKFFNTWEEFDPTQSPKKWLASHTRPPVPPSPGRSRVEHKNSLFIKSMNFYVMLNEELGKPDALPYLVSFMNTSERAGKSLYTTILKRRTAGKEVYSFSYNLTSKKESKDKNTFIVWGVEDAGENKENLEQCSEWETRLAQVTQVAPPEDTDTGTTRVSVEVEAEAQY